MDKNKNCYMEQVMDSAMEVILFYDDKGRIVGSNRFAEKELGYTRREILTTTLDMLLRKPEEEVMPGEEEGEVLIAYRRDKTCFLLRVQRTRIEEPGKEPLNILFGSDISDQERMKRQYEVQKEKAGAADRVRQEFTANVTHELRTPINGIKGHAQILSETELDREQQQRVKTILRACEDMEGLVNSILDYAKLEAGKFDLEKRPFDFEEFIQHVENVNRITIENKGLDFIVNVNDNIPKALIGDPLRLTQILNNLISNARKFTSSGQITLEVSLTAVWETEIELFFVVADTGVGISKKDMDKLFRPFSQVDASIARQYGGTGLGLAISKHLVESMGGEIHVVSVKGEGSNFSFSVILGLADKISVVSSEGEKETQEENGTDAVRKSVQRKPKENKINVQSQDEEAGEEALRFGSETNQQKVKEHLFKIILCLEMERFDKAEECLDAVKNFLKNAPEDVKKLLFRMGMQVRRENFEKSYTYYQQLIALLAEIWQEEV